MILASVFLNSMAVGRLHIIIVNFEDSKFVGFDIKLCLN